MSGMYGTVKPADINISNDVEIFYHYRPSINTEDINFTNFKTLPTNVLSPCTTKQDGENISISGLFNLRLPLDKFDKKGIYTIYIRPKEIKASITDIATLAAYPDVRGVVFTADGEIERFKGANSLAGYRIEYLNSDGVKTGEFKLITSSNLATATTYQLNNAYEKGTKYYYNMGGTTIFCTVTPSLAPTFKPNEQPNIGNPGQDVILVNTNFNPVMIELEMVDHDAETISYMLEGNQLIDKDNALITTFNKYGEIYHQSEYGAYKDAYGNPLYEFKKKKDIVDNNQVLENLE